MTGISNLNKVSIKNYGPNYETLAVIKELKKLGIIKSVAKAKSRAKPKMIEDIKQDSDMVGYTKTLGPAGGAGFPLRLATGGMTQQQIDDINRVNSAGFAALKAQVEQQSQDLQPLSSLANLASERFRAAQDPGAGQRPSSFIQSAFVTELPDTEPREFTESINENAPPYKTEIAQTVFPVEEEEGFTIPETRKGLEPREKIGGTTSEDPRISVAKEVATKFELGRLPKKTDKKEVIKNYYDTLIDKLTINEFIVSGSKDDFYNEILDVLSSYEG